MTRDTVVLIFEAMLVASCLAIGLVSYILFVLLVSGHL